MKFLVVLIILFGPAPLLFAEEALLIWDPSPDADVVGYELYYGTGSGQYSESVDVGNTTSYTLSVTTPGTHYFAVTAYKLGHHESGFSNEVSKEMNGAASASPSGDGGGGGGCALRLPLHGERSSLDAAEMLALIAVIFLLAVKKIFHLPSSRIRP
ncbi:MAG: fibronectin type III domain-containing protein [Candidatus Manganitrophus sp.]|nr:MAG: fibronectin type III domain-containing protein [Candidatus Manganitrophus sp.]